MSGKRITENHYVFRTSKQQRENLQEWKAMIEEIEQLTKTLQDMNLHDRQQVKERLFELYENFISYDFVLNDLSAMYLDFYDHYDDRKERKGLLNKWFSKNR